jgi:succinyl-diaminopimelate desuccinylase
MAHPAISPLAAVELLRSLVRAASPSGRERPAVEAFAGAMRDLGFDRVEVDLAGNAIGTIARGPGPTLVFNGHLDTVPTGDPAAWPVDPLAGELVDGRVWGRGSVDMKGALAAMAVAARLAADEGFRGTLVVSGMVQEEVGGLGARWFGEHNAADLVVLGEPSDLGLRLGHRGRIEARVTLPGRIAHAAKAELGDNALLRAARYALALDGLELPVDAVLGRASATLTQLSGFPVDGPNVVPGRADLTIDYRHVSAEDPADVVARLAALDPEARVEVSEEHAISEDGAVERRYPRVNPAYRVEPGHPAVGWARGVLDRTLGAPVDVGTWWFATDAPHLARMGAPVLGFGPGDPELAHTTLEAIDVASLVTAVHAYAALATDFLDGAIPWEGRMTTMQSGARA